MSDTPVYDDLLNTHQSAQSRRECGHLGCGDPRCEPYCAGITRNPWCPVGYMRCSTYVIND